MSLLENLVLLVGEFNSFISNHYSATELVSTYVFFTIYTLILFCTFWFFFFF